MRPTVGRMVHYTNLGDADGKYPPEQQAAMIVKVARKQTDDIAQLQEHSYTVSLKIFYPTGIFDMPDVPYAMSYQRGHWSWPTIERGE